MARISAREGRQIETSLVFSVRTSENRFARATISFRATVNPGANEERGEV